MTSTLETITAQIVSLEDELRKLRIAQEIVAKIEKKFTAGARVTEDSKSALFTVTRNTEFKSILPEKKTKATVVRNKARALTMRSRIMNLMADGKPREAGMIVSRMYHNPTTKQEKQFVYAALDSLLKSGKLTRNEDRFYILTPTVEEVAATPEQPTPMALQYDRVTDMEHA